MFTALSQHDYMFLCTLYGLQYQ